jgi:PAS domain S-box-containing protein
MTDSHRDGDTHASSSWRWSFLLAIAALLLCGSLVIQQYTRFADATAKIERTYDVLDSLDRVTKRVVDAQGAFHGYLLTRNRSFLGPYEGADAQTRIQLSQLLELVADNPEQEARCRRLINLTNDSLAEMERVLELSDGVEPAAAMARFGEGRGQRLSDELRNVAQEMRSAERSLLEKRADQARLARRAALGFALVSLLGATALAFVAVSIDRNFERRRMAFLRENSARMAAEHAASAAAVDLKRSESFTQSILDHSGDCIQVLDPDERIVLANRPGLALMEVDDADALQGQSWTALWNADATLARRAVEEAVTRGEGRFHAFRPTARGTPKWWDVIVTPIRDEHGRVQKLVTVSRDITNQKRAEQERAQLLSSERAARSEAERAARLKDDFVSTLSHELRTPLNAIVGWIGVLKQQRSPETIAKAIDVIDRNSRRQSQIVDDLLDVSRIMSGKLRLDVQRVDLSSVIEEAVASAKPAADARGVHLLTILGSAAAVQGDPGRLQQIVWNLVSNAIKFTPRGGMVQVTLGKVDNHVHVQVSDTGMGIRADVLPQVFQRFRQGDASSTRHQGGLGLGLAIVKSLVEMHGGSVDAASEGDGHGSVFTVRLPQALAASPAEPRRDTRRLTPAVGTLLDGVRALVLDDEPDARELVQRLLEDAGGQVQTAASASDAMAVLERGFAPDVILSDIGMPDEDGYDFMQRVRHMEGPVSGVPAAALTALARVEDRRRALMSGFQTHLAKPVDPVELVAMVASLTGRTGRVIG